MPVPTCTPGAAADALPLCQPPMGELMGQTTSSTQFVVDDVNLYSLQSQAVFTNPKSGASPSMLASGESLRAIATAGEFVFFTGEQLAMVPKLGGPVRVLYASPTDALLVVGDFVYFSDFLLGATAKIRRWSAQAGIELVAELRDVFRVERMAHQDGYLYVMPLDTSGSEAFRVRIEDGSSERIAGGVQVARGFTAAGGSLYFTEEGTRTIQKVSLASGERTTVSTFAGYPWAIDSDGSLIYVVVQDLDPVTRAYTSSLVRLSVDGTGACVVGSAASFGVVTMYGDRTYWTGDCWLRGSR